MREITDDVLKSLMSQKYGKGYGDGFSAGYDAGYWNGVRDVLEKHRKFLTQVEKILAKEAL